MPGHPSAGLKLPADFGGPPDAPAAPALPLGRILTSASHRSTPLPVDDADDAWLAIERCQRLLTERGERSGARLAGEMLEAYRAFEGPARGAFFDLLASEFSPDVHEVRRAAAVYCLGPSEETLTELRRSTEAPRQGLFQRLNLTPGGTAVLIEMRRELLRGLAEHPTWAAVEADLAQLLKSWFSGGFLRLQRIDRRTPAPVLEAISRYEAVHPIRDGRDLQRRLEADRRCYAFFHPALRDEPVIVTEIALTRGMSPNVQALLDPDSPVLDPASCDCAIFYSISNCHDGLRGVPFGNALIRQVVDGLAGALPNLKTFATLSPVPGFRPWLAGLAESCEANGAGAVVAALLARLGAPNWFEDAALAAELERRLVPLCAYYLLRAKQGKAPADSVARFHLRNGARLERINWLSDTSTAGLRRSAGLMVNYVYRLADLRWNPPACASERKVRASRRLERLSKEASAMFRRAGQ